MESKEVIKELEMLKRIVKEESDSDKAIDFAIFAVKKQIPVKIYKKWNEYYGRNDPCCGICSAYLNEYQDYCPRCGQSINWEE